MSTSGIQVKITCNFKTFARQLATRIAFMLYPPVVARAVLNGRDIGMQKRIEAMSRKRFRKAQRMARKRRGILSIICSRTSQEHPSEV